MYTFSVLSQKNDFFLPYLYPTDYRLSRDCSSTPYQLLQYSLPITLVLLTNYSSTPYQLLQYSLPSTGVELMDDGDSRTS